MTDNTKLILYSHWRLCDKQHVLWPAAAADWQLAFSRNARTHHFLTPYGILHIMDILCPLWFRLPLKISSFNLPPCYMRNFSSNWRGDQTSCELIHIFSMSHIPGPWGWAGIVQLKHHWKEPWKRPVLKQLCGTSREQCCRLSLSEYQRMKMPKVCHSLCAASAICRSHSKI